MLDCTAWTADWMGPPVENTPSDQRPPARMCVFGTGVTPRPRSPREKPAAAALHCGLGPGHDENLIQGNLCLGVIKTLGLASINVRRTVPEDDICSPMFLRLTRINKSQDSYFDRRFRQQPASSRLSKRLTPTQRSSGIIVPTASTASTGSDELPVILTTGNSDMWTLASPYGISL